MKQISTSGSMKIYFNDKYVNGKIISISSFFNHNTDNFFAQELIKQNTIKIVKPLAHIIFLKENKDLGYWKEGFTYELIIKPFGLFNIWGIHYINVVSINKQKNEIITIEKNNICKVWNHKLAFKKLTEHTTEYTDEVTLYAGWLTGVLSWFLIYSYKKRHKKLGQIIETTIRPATKRA